VKLLVKLQQMKYWGIFLRISVSESKVHPYFYPTVCTC
jgi:hypothetical protein